MLVFGPVSSVFDFLTFYALLQSVRRRRGAVPDRLVHRIHGDPGSGRLRHPHAAAAVPEPAACVCSRPWRWASSPSPIALPLSPVGPWFGFVAPPPLFFAFSLRDVAYLAIVEIVKRVFYAHAPQGKSPRPL